MLLLEAGGRGPSFWIGIPVGYVYHHRQSAHRLVLPDRARPSLAGRSIAYTRGTAKGYGAGGEVRIEDPRVRCASMRRERRPPNAPYCR